MPPKLNVPKIILGWGKKSSQKDFRKKTTYQKTRGGTFQKRTCVRAAIDMFSDLKGCDESCKLCPISPLNIRFFKISVSQYVMPAILHTNLANDKFAIEGRNKVTHPA
jgi:hypothetical protein